MFRLARTLTGALLVATSAFAWGSGVRAQAGLEGDWELAVTLPQGPNTVNLSLKQDGEKVTGTLTTPLGSLPVEGTLSEGTVKLGASVKLQGNGIDLGLNGKLTGESLAGMVKLGDFGEFPFTGKRAIKTAAAAAPAAVAPSAGSTTDATGSWDITLSIGGGQIPATAALKQDGDQVTGTLKTPLGEVPVRGTMTGKAIKLELTATTPQGAVPIVLTGDLTEKGFAGKMNVGGVGEADWTATRSVR